MGDHLVLYVDRLVTASTFESADEKGTLSPSDESGVPGLQDEVLPQISNGSSSQSGAESGIAEGGDPVLKAVECRICQDEDDVKNMETPCACAGSLKFAHRKCVQRWCDEKGDITCEICHQPYSPGYTAPPPPVNSDDTSIDISASWGASGAQLDLHDPRLLAMAAAERHFLEAEYDEYAAANASGAAFCRSAALILMALLLLRHALTISNADGDDSSTFYSLFLLRAAGFLLPCYIMAWAISVLHRRRQRQEAAMAATEVALLLQAGHPRGLHFAVAPGALPVHEFP